MAVPYNTVRYGYARIVMGYGRSLLQAPPDTTSNNFNIERHHIPFIAVSKFLSPGSLLGAAHHEFC